MQNVNQFENLKSRFAENGGRLFFVDGFKNRAFSSVKSLLADAKPSTMACVVENAKTANQVKTALFDGAATVISSLEEFKSLFHAVNADTKKASQFADKFKQTYPNIIRVLKDAANNPVLNAELTLADGKRGEYIEGNNAIYAISDLIADAEYSAVVVDNVYSMVAFEEAERDAIYSKKPQKYERVDLMGRSYFTDVAHSYKRLQRLVDSADKAIVISNAIVDKEVISFYAGASLISSDFSYKKAKKAAKSGSSAYNEEVDRIFDSISYIQSDETIQSLCLQRAKGRPQSVPGDLERLGAYATGNIKFMTKEEIFLRALAILNGGKTGASNASAITRLDDDDKTLANTICDIFFNDTVKGDIESKVEHSHIAKMNAEDFNVFLEVFNKHAVYCGTGTLNSRCSIYRIYHDDSGFEDLIRRSSEAFDRNENALSASHMGNDVAYKCIATKNLLIDGNVKKPLLVVSMSDPKGVCAELSKILDGNVSVLGEGAKSLASDEVAVVDYTGFESIANDLNVASVVFFDAIADMNLLDTYVKKAVNLAQNVNSALLITYDDISGAIVDIWQEYWMDEEKSLLSIRNSEVYIKGERPVDYNRVVADINDIYKSYKQLIDGTDTVNTKELAAKFTQAMTDFTLGRATYAEDVKEDFMYFGKVAKYYSGIFANSVSVGTKGREMFAEKAVLVGKKKKKKIEYQTVAENNSVAFNVCSKQLHDTCDFKNMDCFTCPLYNKIIANSSEIFIDSVKGYFKESVKTMTKIQTDRITRRMRTVIGGESDTANGYNVTLDTISTASADADAAVKNILKSNPVADNPFFCDYNHVFDIKEAVQSIHYNIFKKYYTQLTEVFERSTDEMKKSFDAIGQGAKSSLQTL